MAEKTTKEMQEAFLNQLRAYVHYWATLPDKTDREKLDGLAFSFLNMLDGTSMDLPAFELVPTPHEDDKEYFEEQGEDWWPNTDLQLGEEVKTLHGDSMLHDLWSKRR